MFRSGNEFRAVGMSLAHKSIKKGRKEKDNNRSLSNRIDTEVQDQISDVTRSCGVLEQFEGGFWNL